MNLLLSIARPRGSTAAAIPRPRAWRRLTEGHAAVAGCGLWTTGTAGLCVLGLIFGLYPGPCSAEVPAAYVQAAEEQGIPAERLYALAKARSGAALSSGEVRPWPWTVGTGGHLTQFQTREAVYRLAAYYRRRGRAVRIGLLQLDAERFPDLWTALDPRAQLESGARLLSASFKRAGDWDKAIAQLSRDPTSFTPGTAAYAVNWAGYRRFAPLIHNTAARHRLDPALLHAVVAAESNYRPRAKSPKGAQGLMQLIPKTARRFGVTDAGDPAKNMDGGARYLRWLLDVFKDTRLALAGYNAGERAVIRHGYTVPPYRETRAYVPRVLGLYQRFKRQGLG